MTAFRFWSAVQGWLPMVGAALWAQGAEASRFPMEPIDWRGSMTRLVLLGIVMLVSPLGVGCAVDGGYTLLRSSGDLRRHALLLMGLGVVATAAAVVTVQPALRETAALSLEVAAATQLTTTTAALIVVRRIDAQDPSRSHVFAVALLAVIFAGLGLIWGQFASAI